MKRIIPLLALLAITLFGCKKIDEEIDKAVDKYIFITSSKENTPSEMNAILGDITFSGTTFNPSVNMRGDITITDNVPYIVEVKTSSIYDALNFTSTSYTGTIDGDLFNKESNDVDIVIDNLVPKIYVNDVLAATGNGGGGGNGGGNNGGGNEVDTVYKEQHSGDEHEEITIMYTPPAGTKSMTIRTTEFGEFDRNTADMFVRKGLEPVIKHTYPPNVSKYEWEADFAGINPNREDEVYTVNNPSGTYYITLYGYNTYFTSWLVITTTK